MLVSLHYFSIDSSIPSLSAIPSLSSGGSLMGISSLGSSNTATTQSSSLSSVSSFDLSSASLLSTTSLTGIGYKDKEAEDYFAAGNQLLSSLDPNDLLWGIPDEEEYETGFVVVPQLNDMTDETGLNDEEIGQLVRVRGLGIPEQYGIQPRGILLNKVMGRVGGKQLQYVTTEAELDDGTNSNNLMDLDDITPVLSTVDNTPSLSSGTNSMKIDTQITVTAKDQPSISSTVTSSSTVVSSTASVPVNQSTVKKKLKRGIRWMDENISMVEEAVTRHKVTPDELINGTLVAVKYFRKELPVSPELAAAFAAATAAKAFAMVNNTLSITETESNVASKDAMETDTTTTESTGSTTNGTGEENSPAISFEEAKKREKLSEHENIRARLAAARAPGIARGPPPWLITSTFGMQTVENCTKVSKWASRPNFVLANPPVNSTTDTSISSSSTSTNAQTVPVLPPLFEVKSKLPRFINSNKIELEIAAAVAASHSKSSSTSLVRIRPYIIASPEAVRVEHECSLRGKVSYPAPNLVPSNPVQPLPEPIPAFTTPNRQFDPVPHIASAVTTTTANGMNNGPNISVPTTPTSASMLLNNALRPVTPVPSVVLPPPPVPPSVGPLPPSLSMMSSSTTTPTASLLNRLTAPPTTTTAGTVPSSSSGGLFSNLSSLQNLLSKVSSLANPSATNTVVVPTTIPGATSNVPPNSYPPGIPPPPQIPSYPFPPSTSTVPSSNSLLPPHLLNASSAYLPPPRGTGYPLPHNMGPPSMPLPPQLPPHGPPMMPPMSMPPPQGYLPPPGMYPPPPGSTPGGYPQPPPSSHMLNSNTHGLPPIPPPIHPPPPNSRFGPPTVPSIPPPPIFNPGASNLPPPSNQTMVSPPVTNVGPLPSASTNGGLPNRISGYSIEQLHAANAGKKGPQCSFFTSSGGCRNGLKCPFIHDPNYVAPMEAFQRISAPGKPILPATGKPLVTPSLPPPPSSSNLPPPGTGPAWGGIPQPRSGPY